ncbi:MAG: hypothetical protein WDZ63_17680 [Burkholderiales bacterium]
MGHFGRFLDVLLPDGGCALQLIETYHDESESDGILCVAGYLFHKEKAIAIDQKWKEVLDKHNLKFFHMSECAHGAKQFKDKTKEECIEIETVLIELIKAYAIQGYAVSFDLRYAYLLPSAKAQGLEIISPYALCCYFCMLGARGWADKNNYDGEIAYFFENGHEHQSESEVIMKAVTSEDWGKERYRYAGHAFLPKDKARLLQCGDILAWQWRKNVKERASGNMKPRADLFSLLSLPHFTTHFNEETILSLRETVIASNSQVELRWLSSVAQKYGV